LGKDVTQSRVPVSQDYHIPYELRMLSFSF